MVYGQSTHVSIMFVHTPSISVFVWITARYKDNNVYNQPPLSLSFALNSFFSCRTHTSVRVWNDASAGPFLVAPPPLWSKRSFSFVAHPFRAAAHLRVPMFDYASVSKPVLALSPFPFLCSSIHAPSHPFRSSPYIFSLYQLLG